MHKFPCTILLAVLGISGIGGCVLEKKRIASENQACELLKEAATEYCIPRIDLTGRYFCDPLPDNNSLYLLGLRYVTTPDELVGSNLIGWFAIRKTNGRVFHLDINNENTEPLISRCPFDLE